MPRRASDMDRFDRGFLLGTMYAEGSPITTARIREQFRVSVPTAKRDMQKIAELVDAPRGQRGHARAIAGAT